MINSDSFRSIYYNAKKLTFTEDEQKHKWLPMLVDAYHLIDLGIAEAVKLKEKKENRTLACTKGCANCCKHHKDIPVYPLELVGLSYYVNEKIDADTKAKIKQPLANYQSENPCPFLVDDVCTVHEMRPIACRIFMVFNKPCDVGEDPYYTRKEDVLPTIQDYIDQAFYVMLPFYGVTEDKHKLSIISTGAFHKKAVPLNTINWSKLAISIGK